MPVSPQLPQMPQQQPYPGMPPQGMEQGMPTNPLLLALLQLQQSQHPLLRIMQQNQLGRMPGASMASLPPSTAPEYLGD